jgi:VIT1/CCC1 family predicted Fe2+/Mn2+ transporter
MLPVLAAAKVRGLSTYRAPPAPRTPPIPTAAHPMPVSAGEVEQRHRSAQGGGSLRAAVFGVNDGLVSNTCLLLGMAGADPSPSLYVLTGTAGLLAGALSMAAGEYLSVRAQRELAEHQIAIERAELARYPEEEAEELALIYEARGLELAQARELAQRLVRDPAVALDTLAREELGLDPEQLGSPLGAALASFASFAAGAAIPLLPFLLGLARPIPAAIAGAALALFAVGCGLALFTGRGFLWSGARMLLVGGSAGALTWWIGSLVGAALG